MVVLFALRPVNLVRSAQLSKGVAPFELLSIWSLLDYLDLAKMFLIPTIQLLKSLDEQPTGESKAIQASNAGLGC